MAADPIALANLAMEALWLALLLSLPILAASFLVGIFTSLAQSVTGADDPVVHHLPRLVAVAVALGALGPWIGRQIVEFAIRALSGW